ncbi:Pre-mRNA-splicing factor ATP-dependent RNA helicase [Phytophthora cinnamomi]|uniref:Pre-mRNA-splicing factor ATP-dependent RNA helicase n=1 Tax=Phytophthora cinnamomi TaxID=4785 RepID=UPI003559BAF1|nr:Pre-mRNA-splicing factor ATP-dependent RNA helicase [Phytophthora cinnamomi]
MHDIASDDYYRVLGVARTATSVEIEAAYRELAITYHPGNSMGSKLSAEADFNIVGEAYSVLSNADTREIYDRDGRDGLGAGAQPMTKERAMEIFDEFFRFGEAMDPDAPDLFKGLKRAAGGAVYAPAKGLLYGGKSIMGGVIMGSAAIVAGTGAMVVNIGLGIIEMGEAGINAARQREHNEQASYGETETPVTTAENESVNHKPTPSFLGGLKKATVDAVAAPVAALVTSGSVVLASGAAASGYVAGGFVGAASNVASGVHEVKAASKKEPRRVATVSVAQRVAEEMGTRVGGDGLVGYSIRFESRCSDKTKLKFLTDGVLVRECLNDPLLTQYSVVMLDEAHERSIHTDLLFGLLQQVLKRRPDFRVLITSATLDADRFADFFGERIKEDKGNDKKKRRKIKDKVRPCPVVKIPGRVFPVDIFHSKQRQIMGHRGPLSTYVRAAVETTMQVHNSEEPGHILVFLTGQREIEDACAQIRALHREQQEKRRDEMELRVLPLYGALQGRRQREIFDAVPMVRVRKVIVATNIAETSLTIDGVRYVVDCGFTKQKVYNPVQQVESLVVVPISKVSAQQRAGRAGRTAPGKCYRLYNKASYEEMDQETVPEIQRTNLANTVLYLKLLGIQDVVGFPYLDPPDEDSLLDALKQLYVLGSLDATGEATPLGKLMAAFPLEPKLSRALVESLLLDCSREMTQVVAMLSVENVFVETHSRGNKRRRRDESDDENDTASDWEQRMLQLKKDGLLHDDGDQLTYRLILEAFESASRKAQGHRRDLERWCEDRHLRLRALTMAGSIVKQLRDIIDSLSRCDLDAVKEAMPDRDSRRDASLDDRLCQALCAGFFMNAARRCTLETVYRLMYHNEDGKKAAQLVQFHPLSAMCYSSPPEFCVYQELVVTSKPFMRGALAVERRWLDQYSKGKLNVSVGQLYALCGRKPPAEEENQEQETKLSTVDPAEGAASTSTATSNPAPVTADAVAAARARFLARKKRS